MKLTTVTIPAIEMTKAQEKLAWMTHQATWGSGTEFHICGKKVLDWNTDDGHNEVRLAGEDFYRIVKIVP